VTDPLAQIAFCPLCGNGDLERRRPRRDDKERLCCPQCKYVHYVGPRLAAAAIVQDGERICLVRRAWDPGRGLWTFPGGFVDLGEGPFDAAQREVTEETGCRAELEGVVGVYRSTGPRGVEVVLVAYHGRLAGSDAGIPADANCEEVEEVRWFDRNELPFHEMAFESSAHALRDFLAR